MNFKSFYKSLIFIVFLFFAANTYAIGAINVGLKYGFAYFDDDSLDKGTTYAGLIAIPLTSNFDIQVEYGKFEDDDKFIDDGTYLGGYIGFFFDELPIKFKAGFVKEEVEFDEIQNIKFENIDENNFSFGVSFAVRTPIIKGYIEYLQISDEIHTIAAIINF